MRHGYQILEAQCSLSHTFWQELVITYECCAVLCRGSAGQGDHSTHECQVASEMLTRHCKSVSQQKLAAHK